MGHHKRKKPKNARAGCLLCKPHKANGNKEPSHADLRRLPADAPRASKTQWHGYEPRPHGCDD